MAVVMPPGKQAYYNTAGAPLVGGRIRTFAAGTSTPKATFSDAAGTIPNTNPVVLDARGEATVYWSGAYKVQLEDSLGAVLWTVDNFVATDAIATDSRVTLASATTVDLGSTGSRTVDITGTASIQSFGTTAQDGTWRYVRFLGAATLVYNATSMILPGGASVTAAAGDVATAICLGAGNWQVLTYQRAPVPSATTNMLINPNFVINQRNYVSGAATTGANQYTVDRWRVVVSGQALSWSDSAGVRTITAPAGGVEQVIEDADVIGAAGKSYVLSWSGTATATVNGSTVTSGQSITSITGGSPVTVRFTNGTVTTPQFEVGTYATPFQVRPRQIELALCQRYGRPVTVNAVTSGFVQDYTVGTMRAAPTISIVTSTWVGTPAFTASSSSSFRQSAYVGTAGGGTVFLDAEL